MAAQDPDEVQPYSATSWTAADGTPQGSEHTGSTDGDTTTMLTPKIGKAPDDILKIEFPDDKAGLVAGTDTISVWHGMVHSFGPEVDGTATSGTSTTLTDTGLNMTTDVHAGKTLELNGGTGSGQTRTITSNTNDTFTVPTWTTTPDSTSEYLVYGSDRLLALLPYTSATAVSATNKISVLPIGNGPSELVYTLTSGFIGDLFDQGSGSFDVRWAPDNDGAGDIQWSEVDADLTAPAGGISIPVVQHLRQRTL